MEKFQVIITEKELGIEMEVIDYEKRHKFMIPVSEKPKIFSIDWMASFIMEKCKLYIRMSPEELKKKAEETL